VSAGAVVPAPSAALESGLGCIEAARVTAALTPADLYPAAAQCASEQRFLEAVALAELARAFATFDTRRVGDADVRQAHDALQVRSFASVPEALRGEFIATFQTVLPGTELASRVCAELRRIGPPVYSPDYIRSDSPAPPPADFDAARVWDEVLQSPMRCS